MRNKWSVVILLGTSCLGGVSVALPGGPEQDQPKVVQAQKKPALVQPKVNPAPKPDEKPVVQPKPAPIPPKVNPAPKPEEKPVQPKPTPVPPKVNPAPKPDEKPVAQPKPTPVQPKVTPAPKPEEKLVAQPKPTPVQPKVIPAPKPEEKPVVQPKPAPVPPKVNPAPKPEETKPVQPKPAPVQPKANPAPKVEETKPTQPKPAPVQPKANPAPKVEEAKPTQPKLAPVQPKANPAPKAEETKPVQPKPAPKAEEKPVVQPKPAPVQPKANPAPKAEETKPVVQPKPALVPPKVNPAPKPDEKPVAQPKPAPVPPKVNPAPKPDEKPVAQPKPTPVQPKVTPAPKPEETKPVQPKPAPKAEEIKPIPKLAAKVEETKPAQPTLVPKVELKATPANPLTPTQILKEEQDKAYWESLIRDERKDQFNQTQTRLNELTEQKAIIMENPELKNLTKITAAAKRDPKANDSKQLEKKLVEKQQELGLPRIEREINRLQADLKELGKPINFTSEKKARLGKLLNPRADKETQDMANAIRELNPRMSDTLVSAWANWLDPEDLGDYMGDSYSDEELAYTFQGPGDLQPRTLYRNIMPGFRLSCGYYSLGLTPDEARQQLLDGLNGPNAERYKDMIANELLEAIRQNDLPVKLKNNPEIIPLQVRMLNSQNEVDDWVRLLNTHLGRGAVRLEAYQADELTEDKFLDIDEETASGMTVQELLLLLHNAHENLKNIEINIKKACKKDKIIKDYINAEIVPGKELTFLRNTHGENKKGIMDVLADINGFSLNIYVAKKDAPQQLELAHSHNTPDALQQVNVLYVPGHYDRLETNFRRHITPAVAFQDPFDKFNATEFDESTILAIGQEMKNIDAALFPEEEKLIKELFNFTSYEDADKAAEKKTFVTGYMKPRTKEQAEKAYKNITGKTPEGKETFIEAYVRELNTTREEAEKAYVTDEAQRKKVFITGYMKPRTKEHAEKVYEGAKALHKENFITDYMKPKTRQQAEDAFKVATGGEEKEDFIADYMKPKTRQQAEEAYRKNDKREIFIDGYMAEKGCAKDVAEKAYTDTIQNLKNQIEEGKKARESKKTPAYIFDHLLKASSKDTLITYNEKGKEIVSKVQINPEMLVNALEMLGLDGFPKVTYPKGFKTYSPSRINKTIFEKWSEGYVSFELKKDGLYGAKEKGPQEKLLNFEGRKISKIIKGPGKDDVGAFNFGARNPAPAEIKIYDEMLKDAKTHMGDSSRADALIAAGKYVFTEREKTLENAKEVKVNGKIIKASIYRDLYHGPHMVHVDYSDPNSYNYDKVDIRHRLNNIHNSMTQTYLTAKERGEENLKHYFETTMGVTSCCLDAQSDTFFNYAALQENYLDTDIESIKKGTKQQFIDKILGQMSKKYKNGFTKKIIEDTFKVYIFKEIIEFGWMKRQGIKTREGPFTKEDIKTAINNADMLGLLIDE